MLATTAETTATHSTLQVIAYRCPLAAMVVSELWAGATPVVAANVYLRSNANWRPATLRAKAGRLLPLFRYLEENGWEFWEIAVRGGGAKMLMFRNSLLRRARRAREQKVENGAAGFKFATARLIMNEVHQLCEFWHQEGESSLYQGIARIEDSRGAFTHRGRVVQNVLASFVVKVPADERSSKHVMLPEDVERCWATLMAAALPGRPRLVRKYPNGPGASASAALHRRWARERHRYACRLAKGRRDVFFWALALSSGMRRQEIPLLMAKDVREYHGELWVSLKVRPEHAHLGDAKTGPRLMYIGFDSRTRDAWHSWLEGRRVLVERWQQRTGKPDHGMLFVKNNGAPARAGALNRLLRRLDEQLGLFGEDAEIGEGFAVHPHALRHTITEMMRSREVAEDLIQRHLGHRNRQTTHNYGKAYRTRYQAALGALATATLTAAQP